MSKDTENKYFGKDCPAGMVQVEFVGCDPKLKNGEYGWKPCESTFLEVYIDGQRFRIDVGNFQAGDGSWRRGLHIYCPFDTVVDKHSVNAMDVYSPALAENISSSSPSAPEQRRTMSNEHWEIRRALRYGSERIKIVRGLEFAKSYANGDIVVNGNVGRIKLIDRDKRILYYDIYPEMT